MSVTQAVLGLAAVAFLIYLVIPTRRKDARGRDDGMGPDEGSRRSGSRGAPGELGLGTGITGGSIDDAAAARYALSRTPKDPNSSDDRDNGTAIGMSSQMDL